MAGRGITISYSGDPNSLNDENLSRYDVLLLYANHDSMYYFAGVCFSTSLSPAKASCQSMRRPIASATRSAMSSSWGAEFLKHGTGTFTATVLDVEHPVMQSAGLV